MKAIISSFVYTCNALIIVPPFFNLNYFISTVEIVISLDACYLLFRVSLLVLTLFESI